MIVTLESQEEGKKIVVSKYSKLENNPEVILLKLLVAEKR